MRNLIILFLSIAALSCTMDKEIDEESSTLENNKSIEIVTNGSDFKLMSFDELREVTENGVSFKCRASCECQVQWVIGSDTVSCSCNSCSMEVTFERLKLNDNQNLNDYFHSLMESDFFRSSKKHFDNFIHKKYNINELIVSDVFIEFIDVNGLLTIDFISPSNEKETLLVVYNNINKNTYIVNCSGSSCDCRPQFNLETNVASCSCSPCTFTVEEIKR